MKRLLVRSIVSLSLLSLPSFGRARVQGWCEQGNKTISVLGYTSSIATPVQRSYSGCTVTVYITGSGGARASIYSDNSGTLLSNPFDAALSGYYYFYVDDGYYDISNSGTSPTFTYGQSNVVDAYYSTTFSGGIARTKSSKLGDIISVKDFGAKGDGVTNDTIAVQSAVNAVEGGAGNVLYLPAGTYAIYSSINVTTQVILRGAGRFSSKLVSHQTGSAPLFNFVNGTTLSQGITIEDLGFIGAGSAHTGTALYFSEYWFVSIIRCYIYNFGGHGIDLNLAVSYGQNTEIDQNIISYNWLGGIRITGSGGGGGGYYTGIRNNSINLNGYYGLYLASTVSTIVELNEFAGYWLGNTATPSVQAVPIALNSDQFTSVQSNRFENNGGAVGAPGYNVRTNYNGDTQTESGNTSRELAIVGNDFTAQYSNSGQWGDLTHIKLTYVNHAQVSLNHFEDNVNHHGATGSVGFAAVEFGSFVSSPVVYLFNNEIDSTFNHSPNGWYVGTPPPDGTLLGFAAGYSNTTVGATAIGYQAAQSNTTGGASVLGYQAAQSNTTGNPSAIGYQAARYNTTGSPAAVGYQAGFANTTGKPAVVGYLSGYSNTTGSPASVGSQSALSNTTGSPAVIGLQAGYSNTTGNPVLAGAYAGYANTTGDLIAIGYQAGFYGSANAPSTDTGGILIGQNTGRSVTTATVLTDYLGIGQGVIIDKSHQVKLGSNTVTETNLYGAVVIHGSTTAPNGSSGVSNTFSCSTGQAIKSMTVSGGIITAVACGAP